MATSIEDEAVLGASELERQSAVNGLHEPVLLSDIEKQKLLLCQVWLVRAFMSLKKPIPFFNEHERHEEVLREYLSIDLEIDNILNLPDALEETGGLVCFVPRADVNAAHTSECKRSLLESSARSARCAGPC